jgi:tetratricopeptide (TPR) repeat protein
MGSLKEAEAEYRKVLKMKPDFAQALNNLGSVLNQQNKFEEAEKILQRAHRLRPNDFSTLMNLASVLENRDRIYDAETCLRRAISIQDDDLQAKLSLANILLKLDKVEEAVVLCDQVLAVSPDHILALMIKSDTLSTMGNSKEAYEILVRVFEQNQSYVPVLRELVRKNKGKDYDLKPVIDALEAQYKQSDHTHQSTVAIAFSLSEYYEKEGKFEEAFKYLSQANKLKRATYDYTIKLDELRYMSFIKNIERELFNQDVRLGYDNDCPIFIVGMPRSGTTLTEQILASHSQVEGAGELTFMGTLLNDPYVSPVSDKIAALADIFSRVGKSYVEAIRELTGSNVLHITDKMPQNFWLLGLIHLALPKAKIIHCKRAPVDNCLSIFKQDFESLHHYAYDLQELGQYYRIYEKMMAHWYSLFGDRIYTVRYESMVENPEIQTRALLDFCELEFEPQCLEFHKTKRVVKTASINQVRQPIYKSSVKLADKYGHHLDPLREALAGKFDE